MGFLVGVEDRSVFPARSEDMDGWDNDRCRGINGADLSLLALSSMGVSFTVEAAFSMDPSNFDCAL